MKGFNNHFLLNGCSFLGSAWSTNKYALYVADFPFVTSKSALHSIQGELYEIPDQEALNKLDELEEHPDWYERKPILVKMVNSDGITTEVTAEMYFNENNEVNESVQIVSSGHFRDYVDADKYK